MFPHQYQSKFGHSEDGNNVYNEDFLKPVRNFHGFNSNHFKKKANGGIFDDCFDTSDTDAQLKMWRKGMNSIGHIMINVEFLIDIHQSMWHSDNDFGVGEFLNEILSGINKSSGGKINLSVVTDNEHSHIANIIDLNKEGQNAYEDIFRFNVLSNDSCVKEFSFNTAIPTAMSSTIAVAAMNPDSANSLDSVSFAAMNRGISNRLYRNTPPGNTELTPEEKEQLIYDCRLQQNELNMLLMNLMKYHQMVSSGEYFNRGNNTYKSKVAENASRLSRVNALIDILSTKNPDGSIVENPVTPTPIPIKVDLTLEGISGMVIGQMFRINESRLPKQYRYKKICFIVVSEEQNITTDGQWETKISGQMQLFPESCKKLENLNNMEYATIPEHVPNVFTEEVLDEDFDNTGVIQDVISAEDGGDYAWDGGQIIWYKIVDENDHHLTGECKIPTEESRGGFYNPATGKCWKMGDRASRILSDDERDEMIEENKKKEKEAESSSDTPNGYVVPMKMKNCDSCREIRPWDAGATYSSEYAYKEALKKHNAEVAEKYFPSD